MLAAQAGQSGELEQRRPDEAPIFAAEILFNERSPELLKLPTCMEQLSSSKGICKLWPSRGK